MTKKWQLPLFDTFIESFMKLYGNRFAVVHLNNAITWQGTKYKTVDGDFGGITTENGNVCVLIEECNPPSTTEDTRLIDTNSIDYIEFLPRTSYKS